MTCIAGSVLIYYAPTLPEGDRLSFAAKVVGQAVSGRLDVLEEAVKMEVDLPPFFAMIAGRSVFSPAKSQQRPDWFWLVTPLKRMRWLKCPSSPWMAPRLRASDLVSLLVTALWQARSVAFIR